MAREPEQLSELDRAKARLRAATAPATGAVAALKATSGLLRLLRPTTRTRPGAQAGGSDATGGRSLRPLVILAGAAVVALAAGVLLRRSGTSR